MNPEEKKPAAVTINGLKLGGGGPLFLIAGPCVIESEKLVLETAGRLAEIADRLAVPLIFKSSYDKANRSSIRSFRGHGIEAGLSILQKVKERYSLPLLSDIHSVEEAEIAGKVLDILQIPAFLCRQTDLLVAAARTGKGVNVKKGQFLAPWDMKNIVEKLEEAGTRKIFLTERGATFGYNMLVTDIRALPIMRRFGYPVIFDGTHSVQLPGGAGTASSGERQYVPYLVRAAVAAGVDGLFLEVHPDPDSALSDGPNMITLEQTAKLLIEAKKIREALAQ